jgi:glycosyltransferase involved in cell wall biosynthesis
MKILAAVICTDFKESTLKQCLEAIKAAGFENILLNYEGIAPMEYDLPFMQEWEFWGAGKSERKFDQDQNARLTPICIARNMCLDFAQQGGYDYILFVDSDVIIPNDTKQKLFEGNNFKLKSGIVPGRGVHSNATYMFYPHEIVEGWQRADYFTCGFMAIHKDVFFRLRFRWGLPVNGETICSEDPIFGDDARTILGVNWWGRLDLVAEHLGDLNEGETSQF